VIVSTTWK